MLQFGVVREQSVWATSKLALEQSLIAGPVERVSSLPNPGVALKLLYVVCTTQPLHTVYYNFVVNTTVIGMNKNKKKAFTTLQLSNLLILWNMLHNRYE